MESDGEATAPRFSFGHTLLMAQTVKNLPAMWETQVQSLGLEDDLEKEIATHSSILAWEIPWTEEPVALQSMGSQRDMIELLILLTFNCYYNQTCIS